MSYATPQDVSRRLGRPASSDTETEQWQEWLDTVSRRIERGFRARGLVLATRLSSGLLTTKDLQDVEAEAVVRKVQNPVWGRTSSTRKVDDVRITERAEGTSTIGDPLELLPSEWAGLLGELAS